LPRGGQYTNKLDVPEALPKFARLVLASSGQRDVRAAGVLAGTRPLGFAVSNEVKAQGHFYPPIFVAPNVSSLPVRCDFLLKDCILLGTAITRQTCE
jgi:hypothetical protein